MELTHIEVMKIQDLLVWMAIIPIERKQIITYLGIFYEKNVDVKWWREPTPSRRKGFRREFPGLRPCCVRAPPSYSLLSTFLFNFFRAGPSSAPSQ